MEPLKRAGYAIIGTGDFAFEKAKDLLGRTKSLAKVSREDVESFYGDLSKRGSRVWTKVARSKPVEQAITGTKQATRQLKGAATSMRKAAGLEEEEAKAS